VFALHSALAAEWTIERQLPIYSHVESAGQDKEAKKSFVEVVTRCHTRSRRK